MSLSNYDLIRACIKYRIPIAGVYSKDQTPSACAYSGKGIIFNLEDSVDGQGNRLPGSHWVGIYKPKSGYRAIYYDPFGIPPPVEIHNFLRRISPRGYEYNDGQIQSLNSTVCGYYVLQFLYRISRGTFSIGKFKRFLSRFRLEPHKNREILKEDLKKIPTINE